MDNKDSYYLFLLDVSSAFDTLHYNLLENHFLANISGNTDIGTPLTHLVCIVFHFIFVSGIY